MSETPSVLLPESRDQRRRLFVGIGLVVVLLVAAWMRFSGANWDDGTHLHPDERYISTVANAVRWPGSFGGYFDVRASSLSPYNTQEGLHYSYGQLPLFATKAVADALGRGDYEHLYLVGRWLSALADVITVLLVFILARSLIGGEDRARRDVGALVAAGLYAVTVAAIQAAHFFTTDSWLVLFGTATILLTILSIATAANGTRRHDLGLVTATGIALGLTVACKASGVFAAVAVATALGGRTWIVARAGSRGAALTRVCRDALSVLVVAYVSFRCVSPYAFKSSNWLDVRLGGPFRAALDEQRGILDGKAIFPPTYQWLLSTRVWDPLRNLATWQLGLPLALTGVAGLAVLAVAAVRPVRTACGADDEVAAAQRVAALLFAVVVFLYMSTRFQHMGRYLLPIAPILATAAGWLVVSLAKRSARGAAAVAVAVMLSTAAYALAFHAIYTHPLTRVAASRWLVAHARPGARIANENWDDSLPTGSLARPYTLVTVPVFDRDEPGKVRKLYDALRTADYYVLSSPRAWNTIGRLPERFPLMVRYYRALFHGKLGFAQVASFISVPELMGIRLDDSSAEEAFWVYDHPPVRIFRRFAAMTYAAFRAIVCGPPRPTACDR
jgi:hypothetical protein